MSEFGQSERVTQNCVIVLFRDVLGGIAVGVLELPASRCSARRGAIEMMRGL